jgi:glycosyltransferase involved in cell wall biosynthesis
MQLFSQQALAPLDVVPAAAASTVGMVVTQTAGLPARLVRSPSSLLLCPGFPPTPLLLAFGARVIPYIHDLFLISRRQDLNWRATLYSAWPFALAVRRLPRFMVNSADTATKLAAHCRRDAEIVVYRPPAQNVFDLHPANRAGRTAHAAEFRLAAVGTVEPRKNLPAAARIVEAMRAQGRAATLEIVGRRGWGDDWARLSAMPGVTLHGYQPAARVREILDGADALICTSHEEGLGLPLLEAQFAGLPVIAPDQPVFREVLGVSSIFIDPANPSAAAAAIERHFAAPGWRGVHMRLAAENLRRWNRAATADRDRVVDWLGRLLRERASVRRQFGIAH